MTLLVEAAPIRGVFRGEEAAGSRRDTLVLPASVIKSVSDRFGLPSEWPDGQRVITYTSQSYSIAKWSDSGKKEELSDAHDTVVNVKDRADGVLAQSMKLGSKRAYSSPALPNWGDTWRSSSNGFSRALEQEMVMQMVLDEDPMSGHAAILERLPGPVDSIGLKVFEAAPAYGMSNLLEPKLRAHLFHKYGVLPVSGNRVMFQGILSKDTTDAGQTESVFRYIPFNFATRKIVGSQEGVKQMEYAKDYFTKAHPGNPRTTLFGMLVSRGGIVR